jgi:predicted outer membrane repeat protein
MRSLSKSSTLSGPLLGGLLALLGSSQPAHANTLYVNPWIGVATDVNNLCFDQANPCLTIRHAVAFAADGDVIVLMSWSFLAFGDLNVVVDRDITFTGLCLDICPAGRVKLNGRGIGRHFEIGAGADVTMVNLDLYNGKAARGGSVLNRGSLTLLNCNIRSNEATNNEGGGVYVEADARLDVGLSSVFDFNIAGGGGAVFNAGGDVTSTLASFISNTADGSGGAIKNTGDGTLTITQSDFISNSAADGGAIADIGTGQVSVTHSHFSTNSAGSRGGAILALSAQGLSPVATALDAVTFAGNSAGSSGGAIHYEPADGQLTIVNSTFSRNVSSADGGAIVNSTGNGPIELASTTFFGNAAQRGAAIYNLRPLEMNNSIVTDSRDLNNALVDACANLGSITGTGNLIGTEAVGLNDLSCNPSAIFSKGFATGVDPRLRDNVGLTLGAFGAPTLTHALFTPSGAFPGSNAIDSIASTSCLAPDGSSLLFDQRNARRPRQAGLPTGASARCDAGAVEQK